MTNESHFRQWVNELRTTDKVQANGRLARFKEEGVSDSGVGYCCLGIVEVLAESPLYDQPDDEGLCFLNKQPEGYRHEPVYADNLLSTYGREWLGTTEEDLTLDVPLEYIKRETTVADDPRSRYQGISSCPTCAGLNDDWQLTFPQIADMLDYFGVRDA
jgi:hypothetical protein